MHETRKNATPMKFSKYIHEEKKDEEGMEEKDWKTSVSSLVSSLSRFAIKLDNKHSLA